MDMAEAMPPSVQRATWGGRRTNARVHADRPKSGKAHDMTDDQQHQFADQKYLNLETYRKNGTPVATPMWFAEHHGTLYVYSRADAGKVKSIRQNSTVRVVPCTAGGTPTGGLGCGNCAHPGCPWGDYRASTAERHVRLDETHQGSSSQLRKRARVVVAIEVGETSSGAEAIPNERHESLI
jgi:PPOX class probable F420-dependent enzyme